MDRLLDVLRPVLHRLGVATRAELGRVRSAQAAIATVENERHADLDERLTDLDRRLAETEAVVAELYVGAGA